MDNSVNVKEELAIKQDEMLITNNKADLDNAMDSLTSFFTNYSTCTLADEINNRICSIKNIDIDSEQSKVMQNTIVGFFTILSNELKKSIEKKTTKLKEYLDSFTSEQYNKGLRYMAIHAKSELLSFYDQNVIMLMEELAVDVDEKTREKISNCLFEYIHEKLMNLLSDNFDNSIMLIGNKYKNNKEVIQKMSERTLKQ